MPHRRALDRAELLDRYQAYLLEHRDRSPTTWKCYHRTLGQFWDFAGKAPARCTAGDLRRFLKRRAVPGGNSHGERLADSTRHSNAAYICAFYRRAYAKRWLPSNPMADVTPPPLPLGPPRSLELDDVARLLRGAMLDRRLLLMVWLAYGCGLRCIEIARLRREDVRLGSRPHLTVLGKGGRARTIPLNSRVAAVLRVELAGTGGRRGLTVGPVICSRVVAGQPLKPKTVGKLLSEALRSAGVQATGHQLRHTFATELLAASNGRNFRAVQKLLGHKHASSTEPYVAAYDQDGRDAVALLPDPQHPRRGRDSVHQVDLAEAIARQRRHYVTCRPYRAAARRCRRRPRR